MKNPVAGGAELFTFEIARRWARAGHEVTLFSAQFENGQKNEFIDDVRFVRRGNRFTVYNEARKFYERECKGKVDVVVDAINTIPFLTPLYVREQKVPLVYQLTKGTFLTAFPPFVGIGGMMLEPFIHRLLYTQLRTLVLSRSVKRELISFGYRPAMITIAEPGTDHLIRGPDNGKTSEPTILYLNRIVRYKNVHHLVRAFKLARERVPTAKLIIAGCRGSRYEGEVRSLASALGLGKSVEFEGFVRGEDKTRLLTQAWVHVLPSSLEGWGISASEAASCGTPTVAYDVPGLRDSVINGKTGFLVPHGDWTMLASSIAAIITKRDLRERISANALQWGRSLTWDRTAKMAFEVVDAAGIGPHSRDLLRGPMSAI